MACTSKAHGSAYLQHGHLFPPRVCRLFACQTNGITKEDKANHASHTVSRKKDSPLFSSIFFLLH
jgi:hypothetical protein